MLLFNWSWQKGNDRRGEEEENSLSSWPKRTTAADISQIFLLHFLTKNKLITEHRSNTNTGTYTNGSFLLLHPLLHHLSLLVLSWSIYIQPAICRRVRERERNHHYPCYMSGTKPMDWRVNFCTSQQSSSFELFPQMMRQASLISKIWFRCRFVSQACTNDSSLTLMPIYLSNELNEWVRVYSRFNYSAGGRFRTVLIAH